MTVSASHASAQAVEGTVRIVPAIATVDVEHGPFAVSVLLEDLEHFGIVQYDDDRDTEPDREVESNGLGAFEFTIVYDPAVLMVVEVDEGTELGRTGRDFQCLAPLEEPGNLRFGCLSLGPEPAGLQGTAVLADVTFQPVGAGSTFLLLQADVVGPLGTDAAPVEVRAGAVRVTGRPDPTATPTTPSSVSTATPRLVSTSTPASTPTATDTSLNPTATEENQTRTDAPSTVPVPGDGGPGEEPGETTADGPSSLTLAVWSLVGVAGVLAAGTLGLAAVRWRRRRLDV